MLHSVNEVIAGIQCILSSALALGMGLGLAVLSDRLLECVKLGTYVWATVTESKAMNRPCALVIQVLAYCRPQHSFIDVADCSLLIAGQVNVCHNQSYP